MDKRQKALEVTELLLCAGLLKRPNLLNVVQSSSESDEIIGHLIMRNLCREQLEIDDDKSLVEVLCLLSEPLLLENDVYADIIEQSGDGFNATYTRDGEKFTVNIRACKDDMYEQRNVILKQNGRELKIPAVPSLLVGWCL